MCAGGRAGGHATKHNKHTGTLGSGQCSGGWGRSAVGKGARATIAAAPPQGPLIHLWSAVGNRRANRSGQEPACSTACVQELRLQRSGGGA